MKRATSKLVTASVSVIATAATVSAQTEPPAQTSEARTLDKVVVTARFREETIEDIGQTVNVFDAEMIQRERIQTFEDVVRLTPGVDNLSRGPGRNLPFIRGVTSINQNGDVLQQPSSNAIFFDEIPVNSLLANQTDLPLFDLNRVEVLKGPQPTYFGEGSMGGSIRFFSQDPDLSEMTGRARIEASGVQNGGFGSVLDASASFPIIKDALGVRVTGFTDQRPGFIDNATSGTSETNDYENLGFSVVALFDNGGPLTWRLSGFYQEQDIGADQAVSGDPDALTLGTSQFPIPDIDSRQDDSFVISNKISYDFGPLSVESVTGYFERTYDRFAFDAGSSFATLPSLGLTGNVFTSNEQTDENFTQEFRVITDFDSPLNFVGGVFYADTTSTNVFDTRSDSLTPALGTDLLQAGDIMVEGEQVSVFGELQLSLLDDRLRISAGARQFDQEYVLPLNPPVATVPFIAPILGTPFIGSDVLGVDQLVFDVEEMLPRAQIEFDLNEDTLLHASVSEGARNGLFNSVAVLAVSGIGPGSPLFNELFAYDADSLVTYEAGFKSTLLGGAAQLNAAAFYTDWSDLQTTVSLGAFEIVQNVGSAEIYGLDTSFTWQVNDIVNLQAAGTYTDATLADDTPLISDPVSGLPVAIAPSGTRLPQVAELSFSLAAEARHPSPVDGIDLVGSFSFSHTGERLNDLEPGDLNDDLEAINLLNLRLGLENDQTSLTFFVNNLTNEIETTFDDGESLYDRRFVNQPRTYGVTVRKAF